MFELIATAAFVGFMNYCAAGGPYIGPLRWRKALGLPGRSIYYAGLVCIFAGIVAYGWPGFMCGLSFLLWRLPGWYGALDAGTNIDPPEKSKIFGVVIGNQRARDFIVMSARGLLMFPAFTYFAYIDRSAAPLLILIAASLAQGVSYDIGYRWFGKVDGARELLAGAAWGVAFWAVLS